MDAYDKATDLISLGSKTALKKGILGIVEVTASNNSVKKVKPVAELGRAKYGRYRIVFKDGSEYIGKTIQKFKTRMGQHFGKNGTFAGRANDVKEIIYEELHDLKRKALKFKEQDWIDDARDAKKTLHNKINAARKQKK